MSFKLTVSPVEELFVSYKVRLFKLLSLAYFVGYSLGFSTGSVVASLFRFLSLANSSTLHDFSTCPGVNFFESVFIFLFESFGVAMLVAFLPATSELLSLFCCSLTEELTGDCSSFLWEESSLFTSAAGGESISLTFSAELFFVSCESDFPVNCWLSWSFFSDLLLSALTVSVDESVFLGSTVFESEAFASFWTLTSERVWSLLFSTCSEFSSVAFTSSGSVVSALTVWLLIPIKVKPINTEATPTVNLRIEKRCFCGSILRNFSCILFLDNIIDSINRLKPIFPYINTFKSIRQFFTHIYIFRPIF